MLASEVSLVHKLGLGGEGVVRAMKCELGAKKNDAYFNACLSALRFFESNRYNATWGFLFKME